MEVAAMNLPVICSNISGCNEIIEDGYKGKLINPKSTSELYESMEYFVNIPTDGNKMKEVTKENVLKNYSQGFVWNEALNNYQKNN